MKHSYKWFISFLLAFSIILSGCASQNSAPDSSQVSGLASTLAVQTIMASDGLLAKIYTPTPPPPTLTPLPAQPMPTSLDPGTLDTPIPSLTPIQPQNQQVSSDKITPIVVSTDTPCNAAEFVKDVTIPDDSVIGPKEKFTKIWELRNIGTCTWDTSYALVFIWGETFGASSLIPLAQVVQPGQVVDLSIDMVSPDWPACFQGNWMI